MTRSERASRRGFILPLVLVLMGCAALVVSSVVGYAAYVARATRAALGRDRCRFAAQTAIEQAKIDIQEAFNAYLTKDFASVQIAPNKAKSFNWFNPSTVSADRRSIGITPYQATVFAGATLPLEINGCDVYVGIGSNVEHEDNAATAVVPIVATAVLRGRGLKATATLQERFCFGTEQSRVFDYAYFVNNYGWMSGDFTINGDFRANGNVSLKGDATVNGYIYAARNDSIGAAGTVSLGSAYIYNQSRYRSNAGTRARYDTGNLDELGSYSAATASGSLSTSVRSAAGECIIHEDADPVEMPFVSDLAPYVAYAQEEKGTLSYPSVTYTDGTGASHTTAAGTISAHRGVDEAGPSGDASLADAGSLLLVGTQANPIRIDGPVVVDGDVIIKGYVTGQGTIYAGRNIHIIGDIKYVNAPTWTHSKTGTAASDEQADNETKDMLGLIAKGNVVIGDATSSSIASTVNGVSESYACDANDAKIGYNATFDGDYSATECVSGLSSELAATAPGGYDSASGQFGKVGEVTTYTTETYRDSRGRIRTRRVAHTEVQTQYDRRYYQTCCDDRIIDAFYTASVKQVDAIIYNNHGVFGSLGADFSINGALVCRDEGLTANGGSFNWDMRLRRKKGSAIVSKLGLPKGVGDPYTCAWMEIPDALNPVYPGGND